MDRRLKRTQVSTRSIRTTRALLLIRLIGTDALSQFGMILSPNDEIRETAAIFTAICSGWLKCSTEENIAVFRTPLAIRAELTSLTTLLFCEC
tara:strand:- start:451079 stop:451357 length:279 start_codon:yes stop_codon:yes gene_type:complete